MSTSTNAASVATLPTTMQPGRVPIRSWVPDLDKRTIAQATNLSNLPFALEHVALMPDAHCGLRHAHRWRALRRARGGSIRHRRGHRLRRGAGRDRPDGRERVTPAA